MLANLDRMARKNRLSQLHARTIAAGDAELHVEVRDEGSPGVLLLHGGLGTLEDFAALVPFLDGYALAALDTRGHGGSTLGSAPLSYGLLADDIERVIGVLGWNDVILVGHSDGGIAALHVAARRRLAGLVTLGTHADPPSPEVKPVFDAMTEAKWRERHPETITTYERANPAPDFSRLFDAALRMWRDDGDGNYPGDRIDKIACPTLVLVGADDQLVPRDATLRLADEIESAQLGVIPFATHMMHLEAPEHVAPFIRAFIAKAAR